MNAGSGCARAGKSLYGRLAPVAVIVCALVLAGTARAEGDWNDEPWVFHGYWRLHGGWSMADDDDLSGGGKLDSTGAVGAAVGLHPIPNLRIDLLDFTWRRYPLDRGSTDGNFDAYTFLLNAYFVPFPDWRLAPFVGAGAGTIYARGKVGGEKDDAWDAAWNVRGGAEFKLVDRLALLAEYRFLMDHGAIDSELPIHELLIGLHFEFR